MCIGAGEDADVAVVNSKKLDFNVLLAQLSGKLGNRLLHACLHGFGMEPVQHQQTTDGGVRSELVNELGSRGALGESDFHHSLNACSVQFHDSLNQLTG